MTNIDLNLYEIFCTVATLHSYLEAGKKTNQAVENIRTQISNLENELDTKLFEETERDIVILTKDGSILYDIISESIISMRDVEKKLKEKDIEGLSSIMTDKHLFNTEKWQKKYHEEKIVDLKKHFTAQEFEIMEKLGIKVKNIIYTEYEFELLNMEIFDYYKDEYMSKEELKEVKSLEGTGVTQKQYDDLFQKFEKINEIYNF